MIVKSSYTCLAIKDIDTDMIIPAQYLTSVSRQGFGQYLFKRLREQDKNFPLNNQSNLNSKILVADSNFGCGSSREHAVWAISGWGFECVIAKSFADIFAGNAAKNNLMLISLDAEVIDRLLKESPNQSNNPTLSINLQTQEVELPWGQTVNFDYDAFRKYCLLNQKDDMAYLIEKKDIIEEYWQERESSRFFWTVQK